MASADELIREAYFALQNSSPGATDGHRHRARAKKFALRIVRQYPLSIEAEQARSILDQLNVDHAPARFVDTHSHSNDVEPLAFSTAGSEPQSRPASGDTDWKALWLLFTQLPYLQKRILAFVLLFIVLLSLFTPFLFVFAFLIILKRDAVRQLVHKILLSMGSGTTRRRR